MTLTKPRLSIVLPCYNESRNLPLLLKRYREAWEDFPAELLLVENGSTDDSAATLDQLLASGHYPFARVVRVPVNRGYGFGMMSGLRDARGEFVAFSHADMQCAAADVFAAFRMLRGSPDPERSLVKGRRYGRHWRDRIITAAMSVIAFALLGRRLTDINAQPKVFHRSLLDFLKHPADGFQLDLYILYIAASHGFTIRTVPVAFPPRIHGTSNWAFSLASRCRFIGQMIHYMFELGTVGNKQ
jgi:glycosyltransferase involved in cell wall biosynthesis